MREEWKDKLQNALADFEESAPEGLWENIDKALAAQGGSVKRDDASRHRRAVAIRVFVAAACIACGVGVFLNLPDGEEKTGNRRLADVAATRSSVARHEQTATEAEDRNENHLLAYVENGQHDQSASVEEKEEVAEDTRALPAGKTAEASTADNGREDVQPSVVTEDYKRNMAKSFSSTNHTAENKRHATSSQKSAGYFTASLYAQNSMGTERGGNGGVMMASSFSDAQFGNAGDANFMFLAAKSTLQKEKAKHHVPLRVGVSVRYALTDRFGIETGLAYTFLSSDFTLGEGGNRREREQRLHYVGIPVNVDYSLWRNRWFDVYVSGGGMLERNVGGKVTTTEYVNGSVMSTEEDDVKTSKLQWSVAAAAGAQVNIVDGVGIYVEPGVGYYFKNGSGLKTAYSEKPVTFNVKLGLRYTFK